jgi:hypothetical protein
MCLGASDGTLIFFLEGPLKTVGPPGLTTHEDIACLVLSDCNSSKSHNQWKA